MLCHPDWKRTRQGRGFSGAVNPALPREWCWRWEGGGSGEGRSLLRGSWGCVFGVVFGKSDARVVAGAGQVVMGGKRSGGRWGGDSRARGALGLLRVTQERAARAPGEQDLEIRGGCAVGAGEGTAAPGVPLAFSR